MKWYVVFSMNFHSRRRGEPELQAARVQAVASWYWLNGHRPPAKSALQKMARGGEGGSARRENKPYITGAEAKVYATLKSDTIMVIVVYTDSHAD